MQHSTLSIAQSADQAIDRPRQISARNVLAAIAVRVQAPSAEPLNLPVMIRSPMQAVFAEGHTLLRPMREHVGVTKSPRYRVGKSIPVISVIHAQSVVGCAYGQDDCEHIVCVGGHRLVDWLLKFDRSRLSPATPRRERAHKTRGQGEKPRGHPGLNSGRRRDP